MGTIKAFLLAVKALFRCKAALIAENLALRQQLGILQRASKRPKLHRWDRVFWVLLSNLWRSWRSCLLVVQPETVIKWHRQGFKLYWRFKSRKRPGRPKINGEIRKLIQQIFQENPTWRAPHIKSELQLLGYDVGESTVAKYMHRQKKPPSQTWKTFLLNHAAEIAAIDFFTVPTVVFRVLYIFIVLRHGDRKILHFNVTPSPSAQWTANQIVQTFPYDSAPRFLLRDRDSIYSQSFRDRVQGMSIEEVIIAYNSPWQNPFVERVIGSLRRKCLDHLIILNEVQLHRILSEYIEYYNLVRPHLSLDRNSPVPRSVEPPENGPVIGRTVLGGLHHRYSRAA